MIRYGTKIKFRLGMFIFLFYKNNNSMFLLWNKGTLNNLFSYWYLDICYIYTIKVSFESTSGFFYTFAGPPFHMESELSCLCARQIVEWALLGFFSSKSFSIPPPSLPLFLIFSSFSKRQTFSYTSARKSRESKISFCSPAFSTSAL